MTARQPGPHFHLRPQSVFLASHESKRLHTGDKASTRPSVRGVSECHQSVWVGSPASTRGANHRARRGPRLPGAPGGSSRPAGRPSTTWARLVSLAALTDAEAGLKAAEWARCKLQAAAEVSGPWGRRGRRGVPSQELAPRCPLRSPDRLP